MPRVKKSLTPDEEFTAEQIKRDYGAVLTVGDVMAFLRATRPTAMKWLSDVDSISINGKRRFLAVDIARKIEAGRVRRAGA